MISIPCSSLPTAGYLWGAAKHIQLLASLNPINETFGAQVDRIAAPKTDESQPAPSQNLLHTVTVYCRLENEATALRPGMTGTPAWGRERRAEGGEPKVALRSLICSLLSALCPLPRHVSEVSYNTGREMRNHPSNQR